MSIRQALATYTIGTVSSVYQDFVRTELFGVSVSETIDARVVVNGRGPQHDKTPRNVPWRLIGMWEG